MESSRRVHRADALDIASFRPDWAEMQRVPPLTVVTSRDRLEHRARAKALSPVTVTLADEAMRFTYPWCTIGRVRSGYMPNFDVAIHNGTGVLVGANLMLTASHLAPWAHGPEGWWMEFTPAFNAQHPVPAVRIFASRSAVTLAATTSSSVFPCATSAATRSRTAIAMSRCAITALRSTVGP